MKIKSETSTTLEITHNDPKQLLRDVAEFFLKIGESEQKTEITRQVLAEEPNFDALQSFKRIDKTKRSIILLQDLKSFLEDTRVDLKDSQINILFQWIDKKRDKKIDWDEFIQQIMPKDKSFYKRIGKSLAELIAPKDKPLSIEAELSLSRVFEEEMNNLKQLDTFKHSFIGNPIFDIVEVFKAVDRGGKGYLIVDDIWSFWEWQRVGGVTFSMAERMFKRVDFVKRNKILFSNFIDLFLPKGIDGEVFRKQVLRHKDWFMQQELIEAQILGGGFPLQGRGGGRSGAYAPVNGQRGVGGGLRGQIGGVGALNLPKSGQNAPKGGYGVPDVSMQDGYIEIKLRHKDPKNNTSIKIQSPNKGRLKYNAEISAIDKKANKELISLYEVQAEKGKLLHGTQMVSSRDYSPSPGARKATTQRSFNVNMSATSRGIESYRENNTHRSRSRARGGPGDMAAIPENGLKGSKIGNSGLVPISSHRSNAMRLSHNGAGLGQDRPLGAQIVLQIDQNGQNLDNGQVGPEGQKAANQGNQDPSGALSTRQKGQNNLPSSRNAQNGQIPQTAQNGQNQAENAENSLYRFNQNPTTHATVTTNYHNAQNQDAPGTFRTRTSLSPDTRYKLTMSVTPDKESLLDTRSHYGRAGGYNNRRSPGKVHFQIDNQRGPRGARAGYPKTKSSFQTPTRLHLGTNKPFLGKGEAGVTASTRNPDFALQGRRDASGRKIDYRGRSSSQKGRRSRHNHPKYAYTAQNQLSTSFQNQSYYRPRNASRSKSREPSVHNHYSRNSRHSRASRNSRNSRSRPRSILKTPDRSLYNATTTAGHNKSINMDGMNERIFQTDRGTLHRSKSMPKYSPGLSPHKDNFDYQFQALNRAYNSRQKFHNQAILNDDLNRNTVIDILKMFQKILGNYAKIERKRINLSLRFDFCMLDLFRIIAAPKIEHVNSGDFLKLMTDLRMEGVTTRHAEMLMRMFSKNGTGYLAYDEFKEVFSPFDYEYKKPFLKRIPQGYGHLNNYTLNTLRLIRGVLKELVRTEVELDFYRKKIFSVNMVNIFNTLDLRMNGFITIDDLDDLYSHFGIRVPKKVLSGIMRLIDTDFDGKVTMDEFIEYLVPKDDKGYGSVGGEPL